MKDEFVIPQKLTLWDLYRSTLYILIRGKRYRWIFYFTIGIGVLNLLANYLLAPKNNSKLWIVILQSLLPLLVLGLFMFVGAFIICVLIRLMKPGIFTNMTYQFTHWGMYKKSDTIDYSIPWRNIVKVKKTKSFIFLYFSNDDAHVIQKKMFGHEEELKNFTIFMDNCLSQH